MTHTTLARNTWQAAKLLRNHRVDPTFFWPQDFSKISLPHIRRLKTPSIDRLWNLMVSMWGPLSSRIATRHVAELRLEYGAFGQSSQAQKGSQMLKLEEEWGRRGDALSVKWSQPVQQKESERENETLTSGCCRWKNQRICCGF